MSVVDENLSIRAIEDKIASGLAEELIFQAQNESKLLKLMKSWSIVNFCINKCYIDF